MTRSHTKSRLLGNILLGIGLLCACLVQTSVFPYFKLLGAVPRPVLMMLVIYAPYVNRNLICTYAVFFGFLLGCLGGESVMIYPVSYLLAVCLSMVMAEVLNFMPILASLGTCLVGCICDGLVSCAVIMYRFSDTDFFSAFVGGALPATLYSLLIFLPIYAMCFIHRKLFVKTEYNT